MKNERPAMREPRAGFILVKSFTRRLGDGRTTIVPAFYRPYKSKYGGRLVKERAVSPSDPLYGLLGRRNRVTAAEYREALSAFLNGKHITIRPRCAYVRRTKQGVQLQSRPGAETITLTITIDVPKGVKAHARMHP